VIKCGEECSAFYYREMYVLDLEHYRIKVYENMKKSILRKAIEKRV